MVQEPDRCAQLDSISTLIHLTHHNQAIQRVLPVLRGFLLFIFRKTTLHLCDSFPLDIAMLIAGFWCEQLSDLVRFVIGM